MLFHELPRRTSSLLIHVRWHIFVIWVKSILIPTRSTRMSKANNVTFITASHSSMEKEALHRQAGCRAGAGCKAGARAVLQDWGVVAQGYARHFSPNMRSGWGTFENVKDHKCIQASCDGLQAVCSELRMFSPKRWSACKASGSSICPSGLSQIAGEITEASEQPCKLIAYFFTSLLIVEGSHHVLCVGGRSPQAKPDASKIIPQDRSLAKRPVRPAYLSNAATLGNIEEPPSCMAKTLIGEHGKPTVCDPLPRKAARSGMHSSWAASWTERKSWKASSWALKRRSSKGACAKAWRWQSLKFSRPFPVTVNIQLVASLMLCWPSTRLTNWQWALARAPSEPILYAKLRMCSADFTYLLFFIDQRLKTLGTWCMQLWIRTRVWINLSLALSSEVENTRHLGKQGVFCNLTQSPENLISG